MKAELIPLGPLEHHEHVWLKKFPVVLGRALDAEVQVKDRWISRCHCEIDDADGTLVVRDLESSNGTFVNGEAVSASPLLPGDQLTVGISMFKVSYERDSSKALPPVIHASTWGISRLGRPRRLSSAKDPRATHTRLLGSAVKLSQEDFSNSLVLTPGR